MSTAIQINLEDILSIINIFLASVLLLCAIQAQKQFGLAIYKRPWILFMLVSVLMIAGSATRFYISFYNTYDILWVSRLLDFVERILLIFGIYMLSSIAVQLWGRR